jgi:hypothetical protein
MAHFYGGVHGNRGAATRLGTKDSGLNAFANGWNLGVDVSLRHSRVTGEDVVSITVTRGSGGGGSRLCLGSYTIKDGEIIKIGG